MKNRREKREKMTEGGEEDYRILNNSSEEKNLDRPIEIEITTSYKYDQTLKIEGRALSLSQTQLSRGQQ